MKTSTRNIAVAAIAVSLILSSSNHLFADQYDVDEIDAFEKWNDYVIANKNILLCGLDNNYNYARHDFRDMTLNVAFGNLAGKEKMPPTLLKYSLQYLATRSVYLANGNSTNVSFWKLDLSDVRVFNVRLAYGFFSGADFQNAELPYVNFCSSNVQVANFSNAKMVLANFKSAYLLSTKFEGTDLFKATFDEANLNRTNFASANLREADFGTADVSSIVLTDANISKSEFSNTTGLTQAQIDSACYTPALGQPLLPAGMTPPPAC